LAPADLRHLVGENPNDLATRPPGRGPDDIAVPASRDMSGYIGANVISAGQECRHHNGTWVSGSGKYLAGCGTQDVDERNLHRLPEQGADPGGKVSDHRDTTRPASAVRRKNQAHEIRTGSSAASR
jgi:hypothetical protein